VQARRGRATLLRWVEGEGALPVVTGRPAGGSRAAEPTGLADRAPD
jgi:hypothetical protein